VSPSGHRRRCISAARSARAPTYWRHDQNLSVHHFLDGVRHLRMRSHSSYVTVCGLVSLPWRLPLIPILSREPRRLFAPVPVERQLDQPVYERGKGDAAVLPHLGNMLIEVKPGMVLISLI